MRLRVGNAPGQWVDLGPQTPYVHKRRGASVPVLTLDSMRPILRSGGNSITGGGRPPAKAMRVVETEAEWRRREQNTEAARRYRERRAG